MGASGWGESRREHEGELAMGEERLAVDRRREAIGLRGLHSAFRVAQKELLDKEREILELREELAQARTRYSELFESVRMSCVVLDRKGVVEEVNGRCLGLLASNHESVRSKSLASFVCEEFLELFGRHREAVVQRGEPQSCELSLRRGQDERVPVRLYSQAVKGAGDRVAGIRIAIAELSTDGETREEVDARQLDPELSSKALPNVLASMLDFFILSDPDGIIEAVNQATARVLGYEKEELVGNSLKQVLLAVDDKREEMASPIFHAAGHEKRFEGRAEGTLLAKDGRRIPVLVSSSPIWNSTTGEIESIACVAQDISELKRREELIYQIVQTSPVAMLLVDRDARISLLNAKAEELFGYSSAELLGQEVEVLVPEESRSMHRSHRRSYWQDPTVGIVGRTRELTGLRKDGSQVPIEVALSPIEGPGNIGGVVAVVADLSERKRLEEEVRQTQKLEAIGTLAAGVAHDFNNLLMGVSGCANVASNLAEPNSPIQLYLGEIRKSAESGAAISRHLLAFARKREVQQSCFKLNQVLVDSKLMLGRLLGEDIEMKFSLEAGRSVVKADRGHIEQVVMNLVVNARDAMPHGGPLEITTRNVRLEEEAAGTGLPSGDYVVLEVADCGSGMSDEVRRRLFEPFFTTKEAGKGTGLGLATVYGIVKEAGGHIQVSSVLGEGSSFEVCLPIVEGALVDAELALPSESIDLSPLTVLLVEDERTVRMALRYYLEGFGIRVLEARNSGDALRCCERYEGDLDILLTDVVLPGMNGVELAELVQERRPGTKVLFMSAHETEWLASQGRIEHAVEVLHKPFYPAELLSRICKVIGKDPMDAIESRGLEQRETQVPAPAVSSLEHTEDRPLGDEAECELGTLLLVEDDRVSRMAMSELFEADGWRVVVASSAEEARRLCVEEGETPSLLLTDYELGAVKGDELARELRELFPDMPVAYSTGHSELDVEPAGPVFEKPVDFEELLAAARRLVEEHQP